MLEIGTNYYNRCCEAIRVAAREKATALAHGDADSYSDYKLECGVIRGLDLALNIMEEVLTRMSKESME